jgi:CDP-4-dehydro-6-deoxyglucose reductase
MVRIQAPHEFRWTAGQHLSVFESVESASPSYYSIASAQSELTLGQFDLLITEPSNHFAPDIKEGAPLWLGPAKGGYPLERLETARLVVLIAMGTGIAPLRALAQHLIHLSSKVPAIRIVHGVREPADAFLELEFQTMGEQVEFVPVVSRASVGWLGRAGRVQAHLGAMPDGLVEFCVCGSKEMVKQVRSRLLELGASEQSIHSQWG